jgi:hypothetical protein
LECIYSEETFIARTEFFVALRRSTRSPRRCLSKPDISRRDRSSHSGIIKVIRRTGSGAETAAHVMENGRMTLFVLQLNWNL